MKMGGTNFTVRHLEGLQKYLKDGKTEDWHFTYIKSQNFWIFANNERLGTEVQT